MSLNLGPRAIQLLRSWGKVARSHPTGQGYDLTLPTRSNRYRQRLDEFVEEPTESSFTALWNTTSLAAAAEWHAPTVRNLWSGSLTELASFFDEIRTADTYDETWEARASWGMIVPELFSRLDPETPIVSLQSARGLEKLGVDPAVGWDARRTQLMQFNDVYLDEAGHVTATADEQLPVSEEIDQLFALLTTATTDDVTAESTGPRGELYRSLRGYPSPSSTDTGRIEIDFEAATPAIDGHIAARRSGAYADQETEHWAGSHYETWKWDFAEYVANEITTTFDVESLAADDVEPFFDAFWANSSAYTDTSKLSTPVPQFLLGRWGVVQLQDFREQCQEAPEEAAAVLSHLFSADHHLVDRLERFYEFANCEDVSDGNLLRIATTLLMGIDPERYVNFQYQRFETFFTRCSTLDELEKGYDARQYYRICLACRDISEVMRDELPDASMLDVHTLIRLYQDFVGDCGDD